MLSGNLKREEGRSERPGIGKNKVDIRNDALWSRAETFDEDTTLAKGLLVNCFAVGQALKEGLLETRTMGTRGAEFDLFDDGDLTVEPFQVAMDGGEVQEGEEEEKKKSKGEAGVTKDGARGRSHGRQASERVRESW